MNEIEFGEDCCNRVEEAAAKKVRAFQGEAYIPDDHIQLISKYCQGANLKFCFTLPELEGEGKRSSSSSKRKKSRKRRRRKKSKRRSKRDRRKCCCCCQCKTTPPMPSLKETVRTCECESAKVGRGNPYQSPVYPCREMRNECNCRWAGESGNGGLKQKQKRHYSTDEESGIWGRRDEMNRNGAEVEAESRLPRRAESVRRHEADNEVNERRRLQTHKLNEEPSSSNGENEHKDQRNKKPGNGRHDVDYKTRGEGTTAEKMGKRDGTDNERNGRREYDKRKGRRPKLQEVHEDRNNYGEDLDSGSDQRVGPSRPAPKSKSKGDKNGHRIQENSSSTSGWKDESIRKNKKSKLNQPEARENKKNGRDEDDGSWNQQTFVAKTMSRLEQDEVYGKYWYHRPPRDMVPQCDIYRYEEPEECRIVEVERRHGSECAGCREPMCLVCKYYICNCVCKRPNFVICNPCAQRMGQRRLKKSRPEAAQPRPTRMDASMQHLLLSLLSTMKGNQQNGSCGA